MIQFLRGTHIQWELNKALILEAGQPGYDTSLNKLKIGDGKTPWYRLPYLNGNFSAGDLNINLDFDGGALKDGEFYFKEQAIESDFVVEGPSKNGNYIYRKWNSGFVECWGEGTIPDLSDIMKTKICETKNDTYFEVKGYWK